MEQEGVTIGLATFYLISPTRTKQFRDYPLYHISSLPFEQYFKRLKIRLTPTEPSA